MNEFQRKRFDNLLVQAIDPERDWIAREHISRAFGYIDGLFEGDVINALQYSDLFREIVQAESVIRERAQPKIELLAS